MCNCSSISLLILNFVHDSIITNQEKQNFPSSKILFVLFVLWGPRLCIWIFNACIWRMYARGWKEECVSQVNERINLICINFSWESRSSLRVKSVYGFRYDTVIWLKSYIRDWPIQLNNTPPTRWQYLL